MSDWSMFGYCPTCEATPEQSCKDQRYGRYNRQFSCKKAHKDREHIGSASFLAGEDQQ